MRVRSKGMSQTRMVFERLRDAIIMGRLVPSFKLNIAALAEEIGVSAGAVREGLAMLEAEALVVSEPARGYRVSSVSAVELSDLVNARVEIEKLCLAEAIRHGDLAWEGRIVSAFHHLTRLAERDAEQPDQVNVQWTKAHADFHRALVSGCPNQWLMRMHDMLYQQSERYRQLSAPMAMVERDVLSEHQAIVNAVLNRDIQTAQECMVEHLYATARLLLASPKLGMLD